MVNTFFLGVFALLAFTFVLITFCVHVYIFSNEDKWAQSFEEMIQWVVTMFTITQWMSWPILPWMSYIMDRFWYMDKGIYIMIYKMAQLWGTFRTMVPRRKYPKPYVKWILILSLELSLISLLLSLNSFWQKPLWQINFFSAYVSISHLTS